MWRAKEARSRCTFLCTLRPDGAQGDRGCDRGNEAMIKDGTEIDESPVTVLIADDDAHIRRLLQYNLEKAGVSVVLARDGKEALACMSEHVSVALLDLRMPELDGMECLRRIRGAHDDVQVIVITASHEIPDAVQAMKFGAFDYLTKPLDVDALVAMVNQAARTARLSRENRQLKEAISGSNLRTPFIGRSHDVRNLLAQAKRVAALDSTVLIIGESGAGKGLLARMIHYGGPRAEKPFITVSCVALPRELVESELFGHEKGAFTGAHQRRLGRLEIADGGTLFLDEIGDMPLDLQPKLLTFLQESTFQRVGGNETINVAVRVIAATHQDLKALCREKRFREDLFFRINVLPLHAPPLRSNPGDIPELGEYILGRIAQRRSAPRCTLTPDALDALVAYSWPGNVRELENVLERTSAFCTGSTITRDDLPSEITGASQVAAERDRALAGRPLQEIERDAIRQTLDLCNGKKAEAARRLGISEKTIYNKIKRLGLS